MGVALAAISMIASPTATASAATPLPMVVAKPTVQVLTIGDSIMNGFGLPAGQAWPFLVAADNGWTLTNAACDGAGVLQVGAPQECDSNFAGVIDSESALRPDIVIFEGSSNDFGLDNSDLLSATVSELATIRADFPEAQIIGLSTLWGYDDPPDQLAQVNSQVQQAVQAVGGTFVDLGQPMSGHPELMQGDDIHPNTAGQTVLASTIEAALKPVILTDEQEQAQRTAELNALLRQGRLE